MPDDTPTLRPSTDETFWLYEYQKAMVNVRGLINRGQSESASRLIDGLIQRWQLGCQIRTENKSRDPAAIVPGEGARSAWNKGVNVGRWMSYTDLRVIVRGALAALAAREKVRKSDIHPTVALARPAWTEEKERILKQLAYLQPPGHAQASERDFWSELRRAAFPETPDDI